MVNGRPVTLDRPLAGTRYSLRSRVTSWPWFISGTRMRGKERSSSPRFRGRGQRWRRWIVGDVQAALARVGDGAGDRPVGAAPADDGEVGTGGALLAGLLGERVRDVQHLLPARVGHALVVGGVVGDVAAVVVLLDAADAVLEAGRAGPDPGADQALVAQERVEALGLGAEAGREGRRGVDVGDQPGLGGVGEEAVGQQHDGRHVVDGDAHRLARHGEAVGRRGGGEDHDRRVAVAAHHRLVEVGLLGLGRQAGRRAAALGVDDDQRQLGGDGEADGLGLERDAGAGAGGDAEAAGIGGADGGAGGGDLVLGLEGGDAEAAQLGQMVQQGRGRGDRVGAEDHLQPGLAGAVEQAEGQGLVAGDGAVEAGLGRCPLDMEGRELVELGGLAQGMAGVRAPRRWRRRGRAGP